jgi:methionine-rich copper-binding protein CopC
MSLRKIALLAAGVAILVMAIAGAQLASAHSRPVRFDPPAGAVLQAAPAQITGWFTSELRNDPNWNFLKVTDQNGTQVDAGQVSLSTDRHQMSVPLKSGLGPGRYIVTWRTFDDADGEIFGDCYVFYVGQEAADKAVADKFRLDAGSSCQRIEVSAKSGTPVPGATVTAGDEHADDEHEDSGGDSDGIPVWGLIAGIGVGVAAGMVGGRVLTGGGKP